MCVILICNKDKPSDVMIEACHAANDKGAGIAWREGGRVKWKKGLLSVEEMQELAATKPLPYVLHFRIPTVGGARKDLAHPFPIDRNVPNSLEGTTKGFVLFHNGHWLKWRETMLEAVVNTSTKLPAGKYSDSRAMAFCASIYGIPFLELIDEKFVAFGPGPEDIEVSTYGWTAVEGVWASNTGWQHRPIWHRRHDKKDETVDLRAHNYGDNYHTSAPHSMRGDIVLPGEGEEGEEDGDGKLPLVPGTRASGGNSPPAHRYPHHHNHGFPHNNQKGSGGTPPPIPFGEIHPDVAYLMLQRGEISRSQFKKYKGAWFKGQDKKRRRGGQTVH